MEIEKYVLPLLGMAALAIAGMATPATATAAELAKYKVVEIGRAHV